MNIGMQQTRFLRMWAQSELSRVSGTYVIGMTSTTEGMISDKKDTEYARPMIACPRSGQGYQGYQVMW